MLKVDEDKIKKAEDELLEETGYKGKIEFAGTAVHDAYSSKIRHVFIAKNCIKVSEPRTTEEDEKFVEIIEMSLEDFRKHLRSGQLTDVESGYLALDYLGLL
jgi:ADP-ribose pyrophosphatase